jgi:hypothetical protein
VIKAKATGLDELQRKLKSAPKEYRQAMVRALSTAKRDTKPEATRIAMTIYTAGRNTISRALVASNVDRRALSFTIAASGRGILLSSFKHSATKRGGVSVQVLRARAPVKLERAFKARRRGGGANLIRMRTGNSAYPLITPASASVGDMFEKREVFQRLKEFGLNKMSSELQRQIALVFKR